MAKRVAAKGKPKAKKWDGGDEVQRRTLDELHTIARDVVTGQIYLGTDTESLTLSFPIFSLGALAGAPDSYVTSIGMVFEYLHKAGPRAINGKPMFWSAQILHKDDWAIVMKDAKKMEKALA